MLMSMLGTVLLTRVVLHKFPDLNFVVGGFNIHHLYTGAALLIGSGLPLILRSPGGRQRWVLTTAFGIGLALVLDEWIYLIMTDGSDAAYLSLPSLAGAILLTGITAVYMVILAWRNR
ncbi:MAG: hypothetical protein E2O84_03875 [Bacteroidetes bacterium]|nr:MAG: hypothetical protein E2O84_03875 [Bacteroidota bacterium]